MRAHAFSKKISDTSIFIELPQHGVVRCAKDIFKYGARVQLNQKILLIFLLGIHAEPLLSITFVYNLRVRRTFAIQEDLLKHWLLTFTPIFEQKTAAYPWENSYIYEERLFGGEMIDLRYNLFRELWFQVTTALAKESLHSYSTAMNMAARTGFDDIILACGYHYDINPKAQLVPYMLIGLPARLRFTCSEINEPLVGTRLFSAGLGLEYSHILLTRNEKNFVLYLQWRFLHFFKRHAFPIFSCDKMYHPGNLTDLLISFQYRRPNDILEFGFNPEIYSNTRVEGPACASITPIAWRLFPYIDYAHTFNRSEKSRCEVTLDIGYAFGSQQLYAMRIHEAWLNLTLNF